MTRKEERERKVSEIIQLVKSDVGEDNEFFHRYENVLSDMNFSELDMEMKLLIDEKEKKT